MDEQLEQKEDVFGRDFKPLSRSEALELFNQGQLSPVIKSPWAIIKLQCFFVIAFTMLCLLINLNYKEQGLEISVILGGIVGVIPSAAFIMYMELSKRVYKASPKSYVHHLVFAEIIKITVFVTMLYVIAKNIPQLQWLPFLGMFIVTLQAHWLQGLSKKFREK